MAAALESMVHQLDTSAQLSATASRQVNALEEDLLAQLGFEERCLIAQIDDYRRRSFRNPSKTDFQLTFSN
jgi:hypothetical protein